MNIVSEWKSAKQSLRQCGAPSHCLILLAALDPRRTFKCRPKTLIYIPVAARSPDRGAGELVGIFVPLNSKPSCLWWTTSRGQELCGSQSVSNTSLPPVHFHLEIQGTTAKVMSRGKWTSELTGHGLDLSPIGAGLFALSPSLERRVTGYFVAQSNAVTE